MLAPSFCVVDASEKLSGGYAKLTSGNLRYLSPTEIDTLSVSVGLNSKPICARRKPLINFLLVSARSQLVVFTGPVSIAQSPFAVGAVPAQAAREWAQVLLP